MTLTDVCHRTDLVKVDTGVTPLPAAALDTLVISAENALLEPGLEAALPLLTRRRTVYVTSANVEPHALPDHFALLVASGPLGLAADPRVSALILLDPRLPVLDIACPVLVVVPANARPGPGGPASNLGSHRLAKSLPAGSDVRFARAGHPAELAHLIDAFLRDPGRYPAGTTIPRAQP